MIYNMLPGKMFAGSARIEGQLDSGSKELMWPTLHTGSTCSRVTATRKLRMHAFSRCPGPRDMTRSTHEQWSCNCCCANASFLRLIKNASFLRLIKEDAYPK